MSLLELFFFFFKISAMTFGGGIVILGIVQLEQEKRRYEDAGDVFVRIGIGHMDRAVRTAREAGFTRVLRLPAPSAFLSFGANVMWEGIMEVNERTFKI